MSDESVRSALRSDASLVVVEAPAGCGKTRQGADYAREIADALGRGRLLVLTHTHAACSVFADRTRGTGSRVEIRTIDSVIGQIAAAYRLGLGLPEDIMSWIRQREHGYAELAIKVAKLVQRYPPIAYALAKRYPLVICDEHQDSSGDQHALVMALNEKGARLRIFADPMQKIFPAESLADACPPCSWDGLCGSAQAYEKLEEPHRWNLGCRLLGQWTLRAREALKAGRQVDLRSGLPPSVTIVFAENEAQRNLDYKPSTDAGRQIYEFERDQTSLLILTRYNDTARFFRSLFGRRIPLWEGHTRPALDKLVEAFQTPDVCPETVAKAAAEFISRITTGCGAASFGDRFEQEVSERCVRTTRGKPSLIQELARFVVAEPNHLGVAKMLARLAQIKDSESSFGDVKIDCPKEYWDAVRLGQFEAVDTGVAEIAHRRTYTRPQPPKRAISTIHKAKGLECESVILMPCDATHFRDNEEARCLLYVALSRATHHLMLVISRDNPSPLFLI